MPRRNSQHRCNLSIQTLHLKIAFHVRPVEICKERLNHELNAAHLYEHHIEVNASQ